MRFLARPVGRADRCYSIRSVVAAKTDARTGVGELSALLPSWRLHREAAASLSCGNIAFADRARFGFADLLGNAGFSHNNWLTRCAGRDHAGYPGKYRDRAVRPRRRSMGNKHREYAGADYGRSIGWNHDTITQADLAQRYSGGIVVAVINVISTRWRTGSARL